ncbi:MAG: hypothetical protein E7164_02045 [Firmicutes bacterium]|nr:hypothetical protein [Bacillota bacterium]
MFNIVDRYMKNLSINDVDTFAKKKSVNLSNEELEFTYTFIKKNYKEILQNPKLFNIDRYKSKYSPENFDKVKKVFTEYFSKYQRFL